MTITNKISSLLSDSLFKNASYLVANTIFGSLAGFVFWLLAARLYTSEDVGLATTIISATGLLSLLSNFGFSISLIRFMSDSKEKSNDLINSCLTVSGSVSCMLAVFFIVGIDIFSPALHFMKSNLIFAFFFVLFTVITIVANLQESVFVGYRKAKLSFIKMSLQSFLKIPLIFLMISFGSFGIYASYGLAFFVAVVISLFIFIPKVSPGYLAIPKVDFHIMRNIFHYSIGNYVAWIFETALIFVLPLLITNVLIPEMTAYFYMAWMVAGIVFVIPKSVATSLLAEGSHDESTLNQNIIKSIKTTFSLVLPSIVFIFFMGDKILVLFGSEYSTNGLELLWILVLSAIPMVFNSMYISMKRVEKDIKSVILVNALINIGTLIFVYCMLKQWGIISIGYGFLGANIIVSVIVIFTFIKRIRFHSY